MTSVFMRATGIAPIAMSAAALALVAGHLAIAGTARQPDEGTAAHVWQILMAAQVPIIVFFATVWLPRVPRQTAVVLALQVAAAIVAVLPVFLLGW